MLQNEYRLSNTDRFIPTRAFINFEDAFYKVLCQNLATETCNSNNYSGCLNKSINFQTQLARLAKINRRIFNISPFTYEEDKTPSYLIRLWPCNPRRKRIVKNEKILDLPDFNTGFHINTIDWGSNDLIATSISNRVLIGGGFLNKKQKSEETVTEYEDDRSSAIQWSSDGVSLAIGTESGLVQVWNMNRKKLLSEEKCCPGQECTITSVQWHPQGNRLAWGCGKGRMSIRSFKDSLKIDIESAHDGYICGLRYSPGADYLCSSGKDGYVRIWRGTNYDPYMEIEMSNPVRAIAWHPWRSGLLAVGEGPAGPGSLSLWNVNSGKLLHMKKSNETTAIEALDFNQLTGELVCAQWVYSNLPQPEGHCEVLVLAGPEHVVDSVRIPTGCVMSLLWNPQSTLLGTAGTDETLQIWTFHQSQGRKRSHSKLEQDSEFLTMKKFKCVR